MKNYRGNSSASARICAAHAKIYHLNFTISYRRLQAHITAIFNIFLKRTFSFIRLVFMFIMHADLIADLHLNHLQLPSILRPGNHGCGNSSGVPDSVLL